jgi:hypothetical protein
MGWGNWVRGWADIDHGDGEEVSKWGTNVSIVKGVDDSTHKYINK